MCRAALTLPCMSNSVPVVWCDACGERIRVIDKFEPNLCPTCIADLAMMQDTWTYQAPVLQADGWCGCSQPDCTRGCATFTDADAARIGIDLRPSGALARAFS